MGIKGLMKLISDHAAPAVKERQITNYFGRKVAIDASMSLYQFLVNKTKTNKKINKQHWGQQQILTTSFFFSPFFVVSLDCCQKWSRRRNVNK
jgi:hypothetical protein